MQSKQEDRMSREEIIYYVDNLIEANKKSYDKRLAPLLYEFFLRANEKFEWNREKFFERYQSFRYNVEKIKFEKMEGKGGYFSFDKSKKGIFIDKQKLKNIKENPVNYIIYENIINPFFHECLHATDLIIDEGKAISSGLYKIFEGYILNEKDTMINEYANMLASTVIASDKPMYCEHLDISQNNVGYEELVLPGAIMCSAFDMTEIELAKLKDKGRDAFDLYLKNKFLEPEIILDAFESNLNTIYNANKNNDKENIALAIGNIVNVAIIHINARIRQSFLEGENIKEDLERIYYNIYKIQKILEKVDAEYEIEDDKEIYNFERTKTIQELLDRVKLYKKFLDNRDLFTIVQQAQIHRGIVENDKSIVQELIESEIGQEYSNDEFDIEEIARKYYVPSNEPLNDNTALIEQIKRDFIKPTLKEKLKKIIGIEQEEFPMLPSVTEALKQIQQSNIRNDIKYETPIVHDRNAEQQDTLRDEEESMRNQNEDIR